MSLTAQFVGYPLLTWDRTPGAIYHVHRADVVGEAAGDHAYIGSFWPGESFPFRDQTVDTGARYSYLVFPEIDGVIGDPIGPAQVTVTARPGHAYTRLIVYGQGEAGGADLNDVLYDSGQIAATEGPIAAVGLPRKRWCVPALLYSDGSLWSNPGYGEAFRTLNTKPSAPASIAVAGITPTTAQVTLGAFVDADPQDVAVKMRIQVREGDEVVFDSLAVNPVVGSYTASGLPSNRSGLKARGQYFDGEAWGDWIESEPFATLNRKPNTPATCAASEVTATTARISGTGYSDPDGDAHVYSRFQVLSAAGAVLFDSLQVGPVTTFVASGLPGHTPGLRPRWQTSDGQAWSDWKEGAAFSTLNRQPNQPASCTVDHINPTNCRIVGSAFSDPDLGSVHVYSQFRVRNGETVLYDSGQVAAATLRAASGLPPDTAGLVAEVRYSDGQAWSTYRVSSSFTTPAEVPSPPALPSYDQELDTEDDIDAIINAGPNGRRYRITGGLYRGASLVPKPGQEIYLDPDVVLNGAIVISGWTSSGGKWYVGGQTGAESKPTNHSCEVGYPRCNYVDDLFVNGKRWKHVGSLAEVLGGGSETWHFDYAAGRVWVGESLAGYTVELSKTTRAIGGNASGVVIARYGNSGYPIIEKYANRAQQGAIHAEDMNGLVTEYITVQLCHGVGIRVGSNQRIRHSKFLRMGQLGAGAGGTDSIFEYNELAHNNESRYTWGWEGGGSKFANSRRLIVRGNFAHHNYGPGLWGDVNNLELLYEYNVTEDNHSVGLYHELSYDAIIRHNQSRRNGFGFLDWGFGGGITVSAAGYVQQNAPVDYTPRYVNGRRIGVEVHNNLIEFNADGLTAIQQARTGTQPYGPYQVRGLWAHHNVIRQGAIGGGQAAGLYRDIADAAMIDPAVNFFDYNDYLVDTTARALGGSWFEIAGLRNFTQWRAHGFDLNGSLAAL